MITNFLVVAFRQLLKNQAYSIINIGGLGIGLACCIAIGLYIEDELSYDRFHPNKNVYRITEVQEQAGDFYPVAVTPGVLSKELKNDFSQVEYTCRIGRFWRAPVFQTGEKSIEPGEILITDNQFFKMFHAHFLYGEPEKALKNPEDLVLTEKLAVALFGSDWRNENVVGKEVILNNGRALRMAGVIASPPENSHLHYDALLSMVHEEASSDNFGWNSNNYHTYVALSPGTDTEALGNSLLRYLDKFDKEGKTTLHLQHLYDIYLHSDFAFETDWSRHSSIVYIRIFIAVGAIVLLIAIFNFINLCTARAMNRAKEVGVRKVIGAVRGQLIIQFMVETCMLTTLAILAALFMLQLSLPLLNEISGKSLVVPLDNEKFVLIIIASTIVLTFLSGTYPAFYLSVFKPAKVLKGGMAHGSGSLFRKILVVTQFSFSIILIIGTIVIYSQLQYLQNKNLGFDKDNIIDLRLKNDLRKVAALIKNDLLDESSIATVTVTTSNLVDNTNSTGGSRWEGKTEGDDILLTHMSVDQDFISTMGVKIIAGRNFNSSIASDTISAYILNETAVKRMGYTNENAIGKKINFWGTDGYVIGVVKDFHFRAMTAPIEPMLLRNWPSSWVNTVLIKAKGNQVSEAVKAIEKVYKKYDAQTAPYYQFISQALQSQYKLEQNTGKIVLTFSALAVIVSCLGLFGLATHTAEQRTKEIGIRKVLGASVLSIVNLLSLDFVKLVMIAVVIATPVGWWSMAEWLSSFVYKVSIHWWVFLASATVALLIALMTVSFQSVKVALSNPVKALRTE